jgi:hypothetical protein
MSLFGRGKNKAAVGKKTARRVRLELEALEDRVVPDATATTLTVAAGDVATLIADINAANASGAATTINLTQSTYDFTSANNNTYGPNALPAITGNITINGNGAVLMRDPSLGQNTPFRLFYVSGSQTASATGAQATGQATGTLTLNDVTLEGGLAEGGSSGTGGGSLGAGGAVFNQGNLTLNGVTVEQSTAEGGNSGVGTSSSGGSMGGTPTSSTFGAGGAGSSGGAGDFGGGGGSGTTPGAAGFGAGAATATGGGGGLGAGGAIFNMYGTTTLINCTLASNIAQGGLTGGAGYGGAVFNVDGTVNAISTTLADNAATAGGALYNLSYGSTTTSGSSTAQGVPATVNLTDSILADSLSSADLVNDENSSTSGAAVVNATTPNLVTTTSTIDGATTNGTPLTGNPQLGLLTNNGGPTPTMALLSGSAAFATGTAAANVPTTDQRGVTRGNVLDLGSYQGTPPETATTTLALTSSASTTTSGQIVLTATITPSGGTTPPAGTVQFVDTTTGTTLGSSAVTVANGVAQATLTTTNLTPGSHTITATYTSSNGLGGSTASTSTLSGSANQQWLNQVYEALLGRPIDPTGLAYWSNALASGTSTTAVVYDIEQTSAYQTLQIQNAYQKLLGVAAPSSAVSYLQGLMSQGTNFRTIEAIIAGSSEFYQASGGTNSSWLNAVYQDFLGVPASDSAQVASSQSSWLALLNAGYTPTQVLIDIMGTTQYLTDMVEQDYLTYLGRPADPTSLGAFLSALQGNTTNNAMIVASLLGSGEYQTLTGT